MSCVLTHLAIYGPQTTQRGCFKKPINQLEFHPNDWYSWSSSITRATTRSVVDENTDQTMITSREMEMNRCFSQVIRLRSKFRSELM